MKKTFYLYQNKFGFISTKTAEKQIDEYGDFIGTVELEVQQPEKEIVKEIAINNDDVISSDDYKGMKFICDEGIRKGLTYLPSDAYDIKITYKQKVPV